LLLLRLRFLGHFAGVIKTTAFSWEWEKRRLLLVWLVLCFTCVLCCVCFNK
jgi:hypothetical protein